MMEPFIERVNKYKRRGRLKVLEYSMKKTAVDYMYANVEAS